MWDQLSLSETEDERQEDENVGMHFALMDGCYPTHASSSNGEKIGASFPIRRRISHSIDCSFTHKKITQEK